MRVILAGTPSLVLPIFDSVLSSGTEIISVITNPPKSRGRSGSLHPSEVSLWARQRGLSVYEEGNLEGISTRLSSADLVLVVAFGQLIPENLLVLPKHGWVNVHFSHLPQARGAAPVQRLIEAGAESIGYSIFQLDQGMDTGPIFYQSKAEPVAGLTTGEVWEILINGAAHQINEVLERICGGDLPTPQSEYTGTVALAPKISTDEAKVVWSESRDRIIAKILAFNPNPTAWTSFRGDRFLIHRAAFVERKDEAALLPADSLTAGSILKTDAGLCVVSGSGFVQLVEVQPAGKRRMTGEEWFRGVTLNIGEKFE